MNNDELISIAESICHTDKESASDVSECESECSQPHSDEEKRNSMKKALRGSPAITINQNGSRYIAPIDIVRSEVGRAEILRQRSHRYSAVVKDPQKTKTTGKRSSE